ncbi:MAG: DUF222 domain-containing protein [Actinomycetota bacterium]
MFDSDRSIQELDATHARIGAAQRDLLRVVVEVDRLEVWREWGAHDTAHWLAMRYGISDWKARRWVVAAHALLALPRLADALSKGELGIDKVVELTRFATPDSEARLIAWAINVSPGAVRRRADLEVRASREDAADADRSRSVSWWYFDEGRRFALEAELPAAQGAIVAKALDRIAATIPSLPEDWDPAAARRADALVTLCAGRTAADRDPDGAVVVHAQADGLVGGTGGCEIEDGPVIHPETVRRLLCNARVQTMVESEDGDVLAVGRMSRQPSPWMLRQIRYRDRECQFPGCGARRFTEAHHIVWWRHGGRTDLDNLAPICSFHHRLVHEHGWRLERDPDEGLRWFRPDGVRYRAGPSPGAEAESLLLIAATG